MREVKLVFIPRFFICQRTISSRLPVQVLHALHALHRLVELPSGRRDVLTLYDDS